MGDELRVMSSILWSSSLLEGGRSLGIESVKQSVYPSRNNFKLDSSLDESLTLEDRELTYGIESLTKNKYAKRVDFIDLCKASWDTRGIVCPFSLTSKVISLPL